MAMLNNLEGIYAVKFELNYPKALECFHQMCSIAEEEGETEPYILALTNIVSVFYLMNDRHGIDYALKALEVYPSLPDKGDVNYLYKAQIFLSLARMYYLEGDAPRAMSYLSGADSLVNEYDFRPIIPSVSLLYADLYYMTGDAPRADSCFRKALSGAKEEDSGMITTVCLDYGRFMEASGRDGDAIALYEEGLQYSQSHDNLIFRSELLKRLAELLDTNRTYVSKAVNKYSGMSFSSYLNMYRINEATAVISDPSRSVLLKQLADDLGYNSVTVFSKAFQKETGLMPSRYRKEIMDGGKKEDDL